MLFRSRFDIPDDQIKAGIEIATEQVRSVKSDGWAGVYLMSPAGHAPVLQVLRDGLS